MIYPNPKYQETLKKEEEKAKAMIPNERILMSLLESGLSVQVEKLIKDHKLQYTIKEENGVFSLVNLLSKGELILEKFLTVDPDTISLKKDAVLISRTPDELLVTGETGTGKEIIGQSQIGSLKGYTKAVNCAGLSKELIESELFGHERGAFTGATSTKEGIFKSAVEGLVFLDEIGELPLITQGTLLRTLQEKTIRAVGSNKEEPINCKVVCATNKNIAKMVEDGLFREDLYARISTYELHIKPLRDRSDDIELICNSLPFGKEFFAKFGHKLVDKSIPLPHNVRSLQRYIKRYNTLGKI